MLFTWFIRMIFGAFDVSNLYSHGYILGCAGDTGLLAYHGWTQIVDVAKSENQSTNFKSLENLFSNQDKCPASSFVSDIRCISFKNIKCSINGHISFSY